MFFSTDLLIIALCFTDIILYLLIKIKSLFSSRHLLGSIMRCEILVLLKEVTKNV